MTPFTDHGTVDHAGATALLEFQADHGVDGVLLLGTSGEGILLSPEERREAAERLRDAATSRLGTILHTGAADSATSVALTAHAAETGMPAVAVMPPLVFAYDRVALRHHYEDVSAAAGAADVFAYDNPGRFGYALGTELVSELVREIPNVVGVKDSGDALGRLAGYLASPDPPVVYTGHNLLLLGALAMGAHGAVSTLANVVPEAFAEVVRAVTRGDLEAARHHQLRIVRVQNLVEGLPYVASVKELLGWRGLPAGQPRPPLPQRTDALRTELRRRLALDPEVGEWLAPVT